MVLGTVTARVELGIELFIVANAHMTQGLGNLRVRRRYGTLFYGLLIWSGNMTPLQLVESQLAAYNAGDLDAFCANFSADVEVYEGLGRDAKLLLKGMEEYRRRYAARLAHDHDASVPNLHAEIVARISLGNVVIDHECVTGIAKNAVEVIAIYEVQDKLIARVYFINRT